MQSHRSVPRSVDGGCESTHSANSPAAPDSPGPKNSSTPDTPDTKDTNMPPLRPLALPPPAAPPSRPFRNLLDDLSALRAANLETEALTTALVRALATLPPDEIPETTRALAHMAEEKARRAREMVDQMLAHIS